MKFSVFSFLWIVFLFVTSYAYAEGRSVDLTPVSYDALSLWKADDHEQALESFRRSCQRFSSQRMENYPLFGDVDVWRYVCKRADRWNGNARSFFEQHFQPFHVNLGQEGLFTGYVESGVHGSMHKTDRYRYPLYRYPGDMMSKQDIPDRKAIDAGALEGKGLEILYIDDPVDVFFLHIQGSGQVVLDNGEVVRVGFAGKNAFSYRSIGKYLIDKGIFTREEMSAPLLVEWLRSHPDDAMEVMQHNPSYIFFQISKGEGPIGGQGVALTPERSLAIDTHYFPYGVPLWLETNMPDGQDYHRLMISQDTGSAIKGAVRGDIFFGYGQRADAIAGHMKQEGRYMVLLPTVGGMDER